MEIKENKRKAKLLSFSRLSKFFHVVAKLAAEDFTRLVKSKGQ